MIAFDIFNNTEGQDILVILGAAQPVIEAILEEVTRSPESVASALGLSAICWAVSRS